MFSRIFFKIKKYYYIPYSCKEQFYPLSMNSEENAVINPISSSKTNNPTEKKMFKLDCAFRIYSGSRQQQDNGALAEGQVIVAGGRVVKPDQHVQEVLDYLKTSP